MSNLANSVGESLEQSDIPVTLSAVVTSDSIGYPRRIIEEEEESHDGELKDFDEAYDYACSIFDSDEIEVEKEEEYIWFTKS